MTFSQIGTCLAFAFLLAAGQVMFKSAALAMPPIRGLAQLAGALQLPVLWLALILYGSATILWIIILQTVPLSRAYPFAAMGFVLVPAAGVLFFGERLNQGFVIGLIFIVLGLVFLARA